jgi:para-nitrobenzyl esterase
MPRVETEYGLVRGSERSGVKFFLGLRYAQAPTGERRFLPPLPPEPWAGIFDATRRADAAPQYSVPVFNWLNAAGGSTGEDCLALNVWTPGLEGRRPVMVWVHGGGFLVGSGATPLYDGSSLARRGDLVVVTINYRLGALGYAHLGLVDPHAFPGATNIGVRDQIAALTWVRDNIAQFGGDPDNVTVFGQSAGAMSIGALLGAAPARGLIRRAICQSGAADHVLDHDEGRDVAHAFLETIGEARPSPATLARIPLRRLLGAQHATMARLVDQRRLMVFLPVVDGDLIHEQPIDAVRAGHTADIPMMIGTTLDEWRLFRLLDEGFFRMSEEELLARFGAALQRDGAQAFELDTAIRDFRGALRSRGANTRPGDVWCEFQSARVMHYPAVRLAEAQHQGGGRAHSYLFTWRPRLLPRALGACHAIDVPFVFGSITHPLARPFTGFGGTAASLSAKMQQAWIGFARNGDPDQALLPTWVPYDPNARNTMLFGDRCEIANAPLEEERRLLSDWYGGP